MIETYFTNEKKKTRYTRKITNNSFLTKIEPVSQVLLLDTYTSIFKLFFEFLGVDQNVKRVL